MAGHVQAALLCERVLVESDRTVSAIRIVDRVTLVNMPSPEQPAAVVLWLLVRIHYDDETRPAAIVIEIEPPTPEQRRQLVRAAPGMPGESGASITGPVAMALNNPGTHWLRVLADTVELARFRLDVGVAPVDVHEGAQR